MEIAQIIVRPAALSEAEALRSLIQRAYRGESAVASWSHEGELAAGERVSRDALYALIRKPDARLSVALANGVIVGSSLVTLEANGCCRIGLLSVDPDVQGLGLGDRLLRDAEAQGMAHFAARQADLEVLGHKAKLIAYYERRGYRRTGLSRPYPHELKTPAAFLILRKELVR